MDAAKDAIAGLRAVPLTSIGILSLLLFLALALLFHSLGSTSDEPWSLPNWKGIPLIGNTIQYIVDNGSFVSRARYVPPPRAITESGGELKEPINSVSPCRPGT